MGKIVRIVNRIPVYCLSGIACMVVLAITLMPGDSVPDVPMFPYADKVVHCVIFGVLAVVLLWDISRKPCAVSFLRYMMAVVVTSVFGGLIEVLQQNMGMGRSGDCADWMADIAGALVFPLLLWNVIKYMLYKNDRVD